MVSLNNYIIKKVNRKKDRQKINQNCNFVHFQSVKMAYRMVRGDQYLSIDTKTKFIQTLVAKNQGVATIPLG